MPHFRLEVVRELFLLRQIYFAFQGFNCTQHGAVLINPSEFNIHSGGRGGHYVDDSCITIMGVTGMRLNTTGGTLLKLTWSCQGYKVLINVSIQEGSQQRWCASSLTLFLVCLAGTFPLGRSQVRYTLESSRLMPWSF